MQPCQRACQRWSAYHNARWSIINRTDTVVNQNLSKVIQTSNRYLVCMSLPFNSPHWRFHSIRSEEHKSRIRAAFMIAQVIQIIHKFPHSLSNQCPFQSDKRTINTSKLNGVQNDKTLSPDNYKMCSKHQPTKRTSWASFGCLFLFFVSCHFLSDGRKQRWLTEKENAKFFFKSNGKAKSEWRKKCANNCCDLTADRNAESGRTAMTQLHCIHFGEWSLN